MTRRGRGRRADAERQARLAKAARDAAREARERAIEKALADYFEARARAEAIRAAARARADAAVADGERAAAESMAAVCAAIRTLRDLCVSNAEVAELCGVAVADIRELLAAARGATSGQGDGTWRGELGPPEAGAEASAVDGDELAAGAHQDGQPGLLQDDYPVLRVLAVSVGRPISTLRMTLGCSPWRPRPDQFTAAVTDGDLEMGVLRSVSAVVWTGVIC